MEETHSLAEIPAEVADAGHKEAAPRWSYWIPTGLIAFVEGFGGVYDAVRTEDGMAVFHHLGYPDYFATMLGVAKVLGALALVLPVPRTVREWGYAGLTFDVLAAIVSILAVGDGLGKTAIPLVALGLLVASFRGWRRVL